MRPARRCRSAAVPETIRSTIKIGEKTTTGRGGRYMTAAGARARRRPEHGPDRRGPPPGQGRGRRRGDALRRERHALDAAAPRAARSAASRTSSCSTTRRTTPTGSAQAGPISLEEYEALDEETIEEFAQEATVWIDGLDRIHKLRGINFCVDLSATPYFLARAGAETNRIFPWVVSDFGLTDAIESGLVKIPQLARRRPDRGGARPRTSTSGTGS